MFSCKNLSFKFVKVVITRLVFALHCFILVYRVVWTYQSNLYWLLLILLLGLLAESFVTLFKREGREWKWFSPGIFCYLLAAVPCIWLLEIQLVNLRVQQVSTLISLNTSTEAMEQRSDVFQLAVEIPLPLDHAGWALAMEQALLFIVILGRWFLPKGEITRDQLSQILLIYLGMAADIMELFEVFKEEQVAYSQILIYPILTLWSWALLQYTLVLTSTKAKKTDYGDVNHGDANFFKNSCCKVNYGCNDVNMDILGIMSTIIMQDGPFFCFRIYLILGLNITSQMMIFFLCKNALVLLLEIYRLLVIYLNSKKEEKISEIPGHHFTSRTSLDTAFNNSLTSSVVRDLESKKQSGTCFASQSDATQKGSKAATSCGSHSPDGLSRKDNNLLVEAPCLWVEGDTQSPLAEENHPNSVDGTKKIY